MSRIKRLRTGFSNLSTRKKVGVVLFFCVLGIVVAEIAVLGYLWVATIKQGLSLFVAASPSYIVLPHGSSGNVSFSIGVQPAPQCTVSCDWLVHNPRDLSVIDRGSFTAKTPTTIEQDVVFTSPVSGQFVVPYQLVLTCHNFESYRCQSDNKSRSAVQTVLLNVTLSPQEQESASLFAAVKEDWRDRASLLLSQYTAISNLSDVRVATVVLLAENASRALYSRLNQIQAHLDEEEFSTALSLLELPLSNAPIVEYELLIDLEQNITSRYARMNRSYVNAAVRVINDSSYSEIVSAWTPLNRMLVNFETTPLDMTSAALSSFESSLDQFLNQVFVMNQTQYLLNNVESAGNLLCQSQNRSCSFSAPALNESSFSAVISWLCQETDEVLFLASNFTPENVSAALDPLDDLVLVQQHCLHDSIDFPDVSSSLLKLESVNVTVPNFELSSYACCGMEHCTSCNLLRTPILFVHGHAFSETSSPEDSLSTFTDFALALQQHQDVLYLGRVFPNEQRSGVSGRLPGGVSASGTYYYNTFAEEGEVRYSPFKSAFVETYAIRLNEVIQALREETGSDQVIIVAHSMGGLVSRSYMQIFGEQHVKALVMIGTPNNGISGRTQRLCTVIGGALECADMNAGSTFIRKLNANPPSVPSLTIGGVGCAGAYDGVVFDESVRVDWADHVVVNGSCPSTTKLLHNDLTDPVEYPQVLDEVFDFISTLS